MTRYNLEDNAKLFEAFKTNNNRLIEAYYLGLKTEFIKNLNLRYNCIPADLLKDIYQDAFVELGEKIISGKLKESDLTVPVGAYLFGMGKMIAHKYVKLEEISSDDDTLNDICVASNSDAYFSDNDRELIQEYVAKVAEPCSTVLRLFYFEDYTMFGIAKRMNYKSEDVAKTRKNKCMTKLKEIIKKGWYGQFDADRNHR